jgi:hypothetical protein
MSASDKENTDVNALAQDSKETKEELKPLGLDSIHTEFCIFCLFLL